MVVVVVVVVESICIGTRNSSCSQLDIVLVKGKNHSLDLILS